MMVTQLGDKLVQLFGLFRVQPRRRFIEHQNFRLGHHAAGNLQPTLVAVGQVAGLTVGMLQQADTLQPGGGPVQRFALRPTEGRRFQQAGEEPGFQLLMLRHQQVFNHRHFAEQAHVLEGPHHAHPRNLLTRQPFQVLVAQQNSAAGGLVKTGQAVKDGGLPGAVGADQRDDLALSELQRHIVDGQQTAETHHQAANG